MTRIASIAHSKVEWTQREDPLNLVAGPNVAAFPQSVSDGTQSKEINALEADQGVELQSSRVRTRQEIEGVEDVKDDTERYLVKLGLPPPIPFPSTSMGGLKDIVLMRKERVRQNQTVGKSELANQGNLPFHHPSSTAKFQARKTDSSESLPKRFSISRPPADIRPSAIVVA